MVVSLRDDPPSRQLQALYARARRRAWAGLRMRINNVLSNRNAHERDAMKAIADRYGIPSFEYTNVTPTIHGTGEVLPSQAHEVLRRHDPYTGCNAGVAEGPEGLRKLAVIADRLVTRNGSCTGCTLQKTCGTCIPLPNHYRQASAPLETYCQHGAGPLAPDYAKEGR